MFFSAIKQLLQQICRERVIIHFFESVLVSFVVLAVDPTLIQSHPGRSSGAYLNLLPGWLTASSSAGGVAAYERTWQADHVLANRLICPEHIHG